MSKKTTTISFAIRLNDILTMGYCEVRKIVEFFLLHYMQSEAPILFIISAQYGRWTFDTHTFTPPPHVSIRSIEISFINLYPLFYILQSVPSNFINIYWFTTSNVKNLFVLSLKK